jgi:hypothetical protein
MTDIKEKIGRALRSHPFGDVESLQALIDENNEMISNLKKEIRKKEIGKIHNRFYRMEKGIGFEMHERTMNIPKGLWQTEVGEEYKQQIESLKNQIKEIEQANSELREEQSKKRLKKVM